MTRRLLSVCVGAALVGMLSVPAHGIAKPPDLPEDGTFTATPPRELPRRATRPSDLLEDGTFTATPVMSPLALLFQLRPTARRTMAGSLLFGIHPALGLVPTDKALDVPRDHPKPRTSDDALSDVPRPIDGQGGSFDVIYDREWFQWILAHWTARQQPSLPEQNDGYIQPIAIGVDFAYQAVQELDNTQEGVTQEGIRIFVGYEGAVNYNFGDEATNDSDSLPPPSIEILPMPHEDSDITCPYLRQQMIDKHACQIADPEIGRDVLANLESLREADDLLELAKELARDGFVAEAMVCCGIAEKLCPGSPCAQRAADTMHELARGIVPSTTDTEESAEPQPDEPTGPCSQCDSLWRQLFESIGLSQTWSSDGMTLPNPNYMRDSADLDPGVELMVCGLMKACHLLMSQGMQHQAAELARQAYALDPQRVMADPLLYKIHLLAESPMPTPAGLSEEKEPPTCPYCPSIGKTIREIVPEKKKKSTDRPGTLLVPPQPPIDYEVVPVLDDELSQTAGSEEGGVSSLREFAETFMAGIGGSPLEFHTDAEGGLSLSAECSLGGNVYHLRYRQGCLAIWKTTDASTMKP